MFLINNASKYQDSPMCTHLLTDISSYPHCYQLRNKLVSETNADKLTENHLCLTCKSIQSPIRHHNKTDHLRASVYCLPDLIRLNCGLVFETGRCVLTKKCMYHIFSGYNQDMDSCYNQRVNRLSFSSSERPYL